MANTYWDWVDKAEKEQERGPLSRQVAPMSAEVVSSQEQPGGPTQGQPGALDTLGQMAQGRVMDKGLTMATEKVAPYVKTATDAIGLTTAGPLAVPAATTGAAVAAPAVAGTAAAAGPLAAMGPVGWAIGAALLAKKLKLF